jgi:hypothetical protein
MTSSRMILVGWIFRLTRGTEPVEEWLSRVYEQESECLARLQEAYAQGERHGKPWAPGHTCYAVDWRRKDTI